jgi:hypothetical protein
MKFCRRHLSPYQRRSMRTIEIMMGVCIALSILLQAILERHHPSLATRYGMAVLSIAPVIMTIILIARYLQGEKDEYLRNLVVQSMLWGLGMVMVADSFFSYVALHSTLIPFGSLSMDIFVVTATITLEIKLWSNQ